MAGIRLASAGDDIKLWDCGGYSMLKQFNPHGKQNVSSMCWSWDNSMIASAATGGDKIAVSYTIPGNTIDLDFVEGDHTFAEFPTIVLGQESRTCVAFNSISRYVLGGGPDGIVHVWDLKTRKLRKSYRDHKGPVTSVQFSWNDTDIAAGSETGEVIVYNVVSGHGCTPLTTPRIQAIRQVVYSNFKKSLLGAVSEDGAVNLWDTNRRSLVHSFNNVHKAPATGLAFSPRNEILLMSVGLDKRIGCYDIQSQTMMKTMMAENPLTSVDLMNDGSTVAVGSTRGKVFVYDLRKGHTPVRTMTAHKSSVQCLKFQIDNHGDVGGVPSSRGSSVKKSNANNNTTSARKVTTRKTTNDVQTTDSPTDLNGASTQGLDSKNNNRVQSQNYIKDTTEYDTVFSPIRDTVSSPACIDAGRTAADAGGEGDTKSSHPTSNVSLENYGEGLYSPLADSGSFSSRPNRSNQYLHTSPLTASSTEPLTSRYTPTSTKYMDTPATTTTTNTDFSSKSVYRTTASSAPHLIKSTDQTDFHHSHSEPSITTIRPRDHGSRSSFNPHTRLTPEAESGATSLPAESTSPATTPPGATAAAAATATATSSSHPSRRRSRSRSDSASVNSFQMDMVRNMIDEALEDFRDQIRRDVLNLHMDMLKQFQIQQAEARTMLQQYSVNEELMAEIERLREENEKLKKKF